MGPSEAYRVNLAEDDLLHAVVLDHLAQDAAITTANDEHPARVGMRAQGGMRHHLLVGKLIALGQLRRGRQHILSGRSDSSGDSSSHNHT